MSMAEEVVYLYIRELLAHERKPEGWAAMSFVDERAKALSNPVSICQDECNHLFQPRAQSHRSVKP